jgi:hypothetical protein
MLNKKSLVLLMIFGLIIIFNLSARAQVTTQQARVSKIVSVWLPSDSERVAPGAVPALVTEKLERLVADARAGKYKQYGTEVLLWRGAEYKRSGGDATIKRLTEQIKNTTEWRFEASKAESRVTVFKLNHESFGKIVIKFYSAP